MTLSPQIHHLSSLPEQTVVTDSGTMHAYLGIHVCT